MIKIILLLALSIATISCNKPDVVDENIIKQESSSQLELHEKKSSNPIDIGQDFITGKIIDQINSQDLKKYLFDKYFVNVNDKDKNTNKKCLSLAANNNMQKNHLDFDAYYYCVTDILEKSFNNKFGKYKFLIVTGNYANLDKKVFDKHNYQGFFIPFLFKQNNNGWDLVAYSQKDYFTNDFGQPLADDDCEIIQIGKENYALSAKFEYINKGINEGWKNIIYSYNGIFQDLKLNTYFYDSNNDEPKIDLVFDVKIDYDHKDIPMYPILLTIGGSYIKNGKKININNNQEKILINFNRQKGEYLIPENSLYNDLYEVFLKEYVK